VSLASCKLRIILFFFQKMLWQGADNCPGHMLQANPWEEGPGLTPTSLLVGLSHSPSPLAPPLAQATFALFWQKTHVIFIFFHKTKDIFFLVGVIMT
jgi:hypothetical protein